MKCLACGSELEAEAVRPAVVVLRKSFRRLTVVVVEESDAGVPIARQVEVQVEPVGQTVPARGRQVGIVGQPREEVGDFSLSVMNSVPR